MTADITLRGPGDILAVLPYQLGYQPRDSVVVVSLRGRQVGLVVRTDLPPEGHVKSAVSALVGPLLRDGATSVFVVGYEDAVDASLSSLLAIVEQLERAGVDVVDVAIVRDGRRFSPICSDPCCPSEGVVLPDPASVPAVAEYVARGRSPLVSRAAVESLVAPDPARCEGVADAVATRSRLPRRRRRSAAAWEVLLSREVPEVARVGADAWAAVITPGLVADAAAGLADIAWRDGLVAWLAPGVLPSGLLDSHVVALLRSRLPTWGGMGFPPWGSAHPRRGGQESGASPAEDLVDDDAAGRQELLQRLLTVCRSVPDACPSEAAAMCTVTAHVAWVSGDGALARSAVDRALRLSPDYRLARLLERLVDHGLRLPDAGRRSPPAARAG
jgi:hypothetical protein